MKKNILIVYSLLFFCMSSYGQAKQWTLEECIDYAFKNNITIKQTDLDNQLAAIDKKDAFGNYLPSLNASISHSWNIGLNQNITTGLLENQTTQFTAADLNVGVTIYNGLQNLNRMRRAELTIVGAQYESARIRDNVAVNVANAFLRILFNKENLKVQKEQLAINIKQEQRTQELVAAGSIPRGDLLDMNATVALSRTAEINAENALLISKLSLAQLLQISDFKTFDIVDRDYEAPLSATMAEGPDAIIEKAMETRVELKIAKNNLEIAQRDVSIARGTLQPNLNGFYSFNTRAGNNDRIVLDEFNNPSIEGPLPLFDQFSENKGHNLGLQLNIPILNGFSSRNAIARSKVGLERYKIAYSQAELDLQRNVYTAFTDAQGALKEYESAAVASEARGEAFNYATEKYGVGIMNAFDFNQAQTLYTNAQSEVLRTKYNYIFKVKLLELYFGVPITLN
jgi:outer membrane protein